MLHGLVHLDETTIGNCVCNCDNLLGEGCPNLKCHLSWMEVLVQFMKLCGDCLEA